MLIDSFLKYSPNLSNSQFSQLIVGNKKSRESFGGEGALVEQEWRECEHK